MGIEYKIKFDQTQVITDLNAFLEQITNEVKNDEISVALDEDGFYFCDNLGSREKAAVIFYKLINQALSSGDVTICGL